MTAAGKQLIEKGASAALIKGGHLPGEAIDVLVTDDDVEIFAGTRLPREMRGTGCMLAMSLACELALGRDLVPAIQNARAYVRGKLQVAF
jgi:hydroxymethylpyrimidine/phosphomethylpyrimidine kinase